MTEESKHGEEAQEKRKPLGVKLGVWTDRMLAALKLGVKGGKWFSLIDKVYNIKTLQKSWFKVASNGGSHGVDRVRLKEYEANLSARIEKLHRSLKEEKYQAKPVRRVWISKDGSNEKRPLGIPTVEDRIVQTALLMVVEPIFEKLFHRNSYDFRPGRGCKDALKHIESSLSEGTLHEKK